MEHIAFKCCECGVINVYKSYRCDGNMCMKCGSGCIKPIGDCVVHDKSKNVLEARISIDTTDIDRALRKVKLLNDNINDTVLRMGELDGKGVC